jgi:hypothetical protein
MTRGLTSGGYGLRRREALPGSSFRGSAALRALPLLLGMAGLIVQLVLASSHLSFAAPVSNPVTELAALTGMGEHGILCAGDADQQQGHPGHGDADCPGLCCHLGHGLAVLLLSPPVVSAVEHRRAIEVRPRLVASPPRLARLFSAQPRGPPHTV